MLLGIVRRCCWLMFRWIIVLPVLVANESALFTEFALHIVSKTVAYWMFEVTVVVSAASSFEEFAYSLPWLLLVYVGLVVTEFASILHITRPL